MKTFVKVWLTIALLAIGFGIAILVICFAGGGSFKEVQTYSIEETYQGVKAVDIQVKVGEVHIVSGDEFGIKGENLTKDSLESYVKEDGTWVIHEDPGSAFKVFGIHFSVKQIFWWSDDLKPELTVILPKDFAADNFNLDIGAGTADAQVILSRKGEFSVGAGRISMERLELTEASKFNVGTGSMDIGAIIARDINVDCGVGKISMNGTVAGESKLECGVGHIDMQLDGNSGDYSYMVECGIGNIKIDDDSYRSTSGKKIINRNAQNNLNLECGIGNINIEFNGKVF